MYTLMFISCSHESITSNLREHACNNKSIYFRKFKLLGMNNKTTVNTKQMKQNCNLRE